MKSTASTSGVGRFSLRQEKRDICKITPNQRINRWLCLVYGFIFLVLCPALYAQAVPTINQVEVKNSDGETVFLLNFYPQGSGGSTGNFSQAEINCVVEAAQYWVDILKATGQMPAVLDADGKEVLDANGNVVRQPVSIQIIKDDSYGAHNAYAGYSDLTQSTADGYMLPLAQNILADGQYTDGSLYNTGPSGEQVIIGIGSAWNVITGNQSQVGRIADDLGPVIVHELGHALGITAGAGYVYDSELDVYKVAFGGTLTRWDSRLRDNNGNQAQADQTIGYDKNKSGTIFDMGNPDSPSDGENPSRPTFVGKNVLELWYDKPLEQLTADQKKHGVPIQGYSYRFAEYLGETDPVWDGWYYYGSGSLSHINTTNGLMSHQAFRNYSGFTEIELAVLQDLGYTIERRDYFGKSFYVNGDGETQIINSQGFGKWNSSGQNYLSEGNTSTYAIGAHLFAKNLNVLQTGTILANGAGSAGIRIDGQNNKLTIAENTGVAANGLNGYGILVAYGKNHQIIQRGLVTATGEGGIGIGFNLGENLVGENRSSYYKETVNYRDPEDETLKSKKVTLDELDGALVSKLDVTGTITGSQSKVTIAWSKLTGDDDGDDDNGDNDGDDDGSGDDDGDDNGNGDDDNGDDGNGDDDNGDDGNGDDDDGDDGSDNDGTGALYANFQGANSLVPGSTIYDIQENDDGSLALLIGTVTKSVLGAAIHIDSSAHVETINIMNGAQINGDILSYYTGPTVSDDDDSDDDDNVLIPTDYRTTITFGLTPDSNGEATRVADKNFKFTYSGNINVIRYHYEIEDGNGNVVGEDWIEEVTPGSQTMGLEFKGGLTEFESNTVYVSALTVDEGATLSLTRSTTEPDRLSKITVSTYGNTIGWYTLNQDDEVIPSTNLLSLYNNGRISGDGAFHFELDAINLIKLEDGSPRIISSNGTFKNNGTIAPGANDGADVGIITIRGDLEFGKNSVYELTIGGKAENRLVSGIRDDGHFVDEDGTVWVLDPIYSLDTDNGVVDYKYYPGADGYDIVGIIRGTNEQEIRGTGNDVIVVSCNTKLDGTLKIDFLPDAMLGNETSTHTIIQSGTFTANSNFTKIEYDTGFLYVTDVFINPTNSHEAQIQVVRDLDYFKRYAKTHNEIAVATAFDSSIFALPEMVFSLGDKSNSRDALRSMYNQMGASVRANAAMMNLWSPSEVVFNRIGWGNGQMETGDRGRVNWNRIAGRNAKILGQAPRSRTAGFWGDTFHTTFNAGTDHNSDKYRNSRTGVMIGGEWNLTPYSSVGLIGAYADSQLKQQNDKVDSDDYMLGLYFVCAPYNQFEIKSYIGLGFQEYDMNRRIINSDITYRDKVGINDRYVSDTQGNTFNFSLEVARPLMLHPTFIIRPTLGLDLQYLWQDGFLENDLSEIPDSYGSNLYGLQFRRMKHHRSLLRAGFSSETSGDRGGIRMRAFYVTQISGGNYPVSSARFGTTGSGFTVRGVNLGDSFLNFGVGAHYWIDGEHTTSLFFDYDANIYTTSHKVHAHSVNAGLLFNF